MKITRDQVEKILEIMEGFGVSGDNVFRSNYSGRFMYGRKCVGFVVNPQYSIAVGAAIEAVFSAEGDPDKGIFMVRDACLDDMAFNVIIYFPSITLEEENEDGQ